MRASRRRQDSCTAPRPPALCLPRSVLLPVRALFPSCVRPQMYKDDGMSEGDMRTLLTTFPNQTLDFFGALRCAIRATCPQHVAYASWPARRTPSARAPHLHRTHALHTCSDYTRALACLCMRACTSVHPRANPAHSFLALVPCSAVRPRTTSRSGTGSRRTSSTGKLRVRAAGTLPPPSLPPTPHPYPHPHPQPYPHHYQQHHTDAPLQRPTRT